MWNHWIVFTRDFGVSTFVKLNQGIFVFFFTRDLKRFNICRCEITRYFLGRPQDNFKRCLWWQKTSFGLFFFKANTQSSPNSTKCFFYAHTLPDHKHCIVTKQDVKLNLKKCKKFQCNGVQELTNLPTFILSIWLQQPLKNVPVRVNQLLFVGQIKIKVLSSDMYCKLTATHAGECSHSPTSFILPKQYTYSLITLVLHCSSQMLITTSALDNAPKHFCSYISCRLSCN